MYVSGTCHKSYAKRNCAWKTNIPFEYLLKSVAQLFSLLASRHETKQNFSIMLVSLRLGVHSYARIIINIISGRAAFVNVAQNEIFH